jgi:hypothetical protein
MVRHTDKSTQDDPGSLENKFGILKAGSSQILPDVSAILSRSKHHRDANSPLWQIAKAALVEAQALVHPRAVWAKWEHESLVSELNTHLPEDILSGTGSATGVICTIGCQLEQRVSWLFSAERFSESYLLDHVGTLAVANWAKQAARTLCTEKQAVRWAPGDDQQDWLLSSQRMLFEWIPADKIGVQLSSNNVMRPAKSLSYLLLGGNTFDHHECRIQCRCCVWNGSCDLQAASQPRKAG